MRDIFSEIFENQPLDPMEAARRNARSALRKRFYRQAHVGEVDGRFALLVDDRPAKTPAHRALAAPTRPLAEELVKEWNAQADVIDPARMPLTRLANAVIDAVAEAAQPVAEEVAKYLGTDLLCYRADRPEGLVERQARAWDPILAWAREQFGARFVLAHGVMHVTQAAEAIATMRAMIPSEPWRLGAVSAITTLTGSALLALALNEGALEAEAAWAVAHVDEDWQMQQWGRDEMALERRAYRRSEFDAAATVLRLVD